MRKRIKEALERLDATGKQINAIILKCKSLPPERQDEAIDYIENSYSLQDIFDYFKSDNQDESYIDLRDYPHIPTNAIKQYSKHPIGVWFRLKRGEWVFVKKENLERVRFNWDNGEIVMPERLRRV